MFSIKHDEVNKIAEEIQGYKEDIEAVRKELYSVANSSAIKTSSYSDIKKAIRVQAVNVHDNGKRIDNVGKNLKKIVKKYVDLDQSLADKAASTMSFDTRTSKLGLALSTSKAIFDKAQDLAQKLKLAELGPFGKLIDAVQKGSQAKWGNVVSDIITALESMGKNITKVTDGSGSKWAMDWEKLMGINDFKVEEGVLKDAINKYRIPKKGISAACKWATSLITSAYDNYKEFGVINKRFLEETGVETMASVAEGVAAATAAGLMAVAVTAVTGVAMPVVAVTAAGVALTFAADLALDGLTKWSTKGAETSWKEAVSDRVCDWLDNKMPKILKKAKSGFTTANWNGLVYGTY